ncbi:glycoside hydrolase family 17 protein [Dothistroma septosporum NZE10]|uniref:Glycoside hydrolase family 17 protein n=1 Tax=Dothistroma septosporum (strain NZE10 / CBS 128990) TaxID=675120 RepID=M2WK39_DOTSN|nr:glycoside hydrolase family 17 protein [Dothistroma septosporum NZE10]
MRCTSLLALAGAAAAQYRGFNYGATDNSGAVRTEQDFANEFNRAKSLQGTSGFASARLYTMIQGGTPNTVTSAIPAAIDTQTSLLLGLWGSAGEDAFMQELTALENAIKQYGTGFTSLIVGISVGSEDLYRVSPTGVENKSGAGATPDALVSYIQQVRSTIAGTAASGAKIGHVDTWTAWVNGSNAAVIEAVDWLGMDGYPYYETTVSNGIANGASLFFESYNATVGVANGKDVWVTETGWPYQGPTAGQAVASLQNAETYWQDVACRLLGNINTWWFTLYDPQASTSEISFGLVGSDLNSAPLYDLTCKNGNSQGSSAASASTPSSSAAAPTMPTSVADSKTLSIETTPNILSVPAASQTGSGKTMTVYSSTLVTVTSCLGGCPEGATTLATEPAAVSTVPAASATAPASSGSNCPTDLNGQYEYPHLIVPVDSQIPEKAYGTSYNGTINPTVSSIFNFDIPPSAAGKTCSLVFLFPSQKDLQTSAYTFNGKGGIKVSELTAPATEQTTYETIPASSGNVQTIASVAPGNEYLVFSHECGAGQRVAFDFSSTGGLDLSYFQDYNPSPIGAYVTVC